MVYMVCMSRVGSVQARCSCWTSTALVTCQVYMARCTWSTWCVCPGLVQSRPGVCAGRVLRSLRRARLSTTPELPERPTQQCRTRHHDRPDADALQLCILCLTRARSQVRTDNEFANLNFLNCSIRCFGGCKNSPICFQTGRHTAWHSVSVVGLDQRS